MKARTEDYIGGGLNAVASNIINPRHADDSWFNTFQVQNIIKNEVFSDVYLIKTKDKGEFKTLRKLNKCIFRDNEG